jgi:hypothetical protein
VERCNGQVPMLELLIPIVMYCSVTPGEINNCNGTTKFYDEVLDPVTTPSKCLLEGSIRAMQYVTEWDRDHPNKPIEYRIRCERSSKRT